jgi:intracellular septation protein
MSSLLEFLLIVAFFVSYKWQGIYVATAVIMAGSMLVLAASWWKTRKLETLPLFVAILALVFGSVTLLLHDPVYIKWKFSVVEWLLGTILVGSQFLGKKPLLRRAMEEKLQVPDAVWVRLNLMWGLFFLFLGTLNVYVIYNFSTDAWVKFKVWGVSALMLVFVVLQALYLSRHMPEQQEKN